MGAQSLKIAYVVSSYHPRLGGAETHVRQFAQGCVEAGDHVTVLTHQFDASAVDEWIGGVRVHRFPLTMSSENYQFSLSLSRHLKAHVADFDLIHLKSYHTLVGNAAFDSGFPFVVTSRYPGAGHRQFQAVLHRSYAPARPSSAILVVVVDGSDHSRLMEYAVACDLELSFWAEVIARARDGYLRGTFAGSPSPWKGGLTCPRSPTSRVLRNQRLWRQLDSHIVPSPVGYNVASAVTGSSPPGPASSLPDSRGLDRLVRTGRHCGGGASIQCSRNGAY
jgi:Glycosyltransferase Family 4